MKINEIIVHNVAIILYENMYTGRSATLLKSTIYKELNEITNAVCDTILDRLYE